MAKWIATMQQDGTLCKVRVASLDRAYRAVRAAKDSIVHPEPGVHTSRRMAALFAHAFDAVHQLYAEAHEHSPDVPLSHAQFVQQTVSAPSTPVQRESPTKRQRVSNKEKVYYTRSRAR